MHCDCSRADTPAVFIPQVLFIPNGDRWIDAEALLIDDLFKFSVSKDGSIQQQDLQIMFDIINNRYLNRRITIFSSEYTVAEIKDVDAALGSRIFSMIHPYGMKCEGANRRFAEVQK